MLKLWTVFKPFVNVWKKIVWKKPCQNLWSVQLLCSYTESCSLCVCVRACVRACVCLYSTSGWLVSDAKLDLNASVNEVFFVMFSFILPVCVLPLQRAQLTETVHTTRLGVEFVFLCFLGCMIYRYVGVCFVLSWTVESFHFMFCHWHNKLKSTLFEFFASSPLLWS